MKTHHPPPSITLRDLILRKIKEKDLSKSQLVQSIGYRNVTKGIKRLDCFLNTLNTPSDEFASTLLSVLDINCLDFHRAFTASIAQMNAEAEARAQKAFIPFIEVLVDDSTSPYFAAQIFFNQRRVLVPVEILALPITKELDAVFAIFQRHVHTLVYEKISANLPSLLPLTEQEQEARLRKIRGFRYYRNYKYVLEFNNEYNLVKIDSVAGGKTKEWELGDRMISILGSDRR